MWAIVALLLLLHGDIGQVHEFIVDITDVRPVAGGAEPTKALPVIIATKRFERCYEDVNSQVEFLPVNQQRIGNVAGNHIALVGLVVLHAGRNLHQRLLLPPLCLVQLIQQKYSCQKIKKYISNFILALRILSWRKKHFDTCRWRRLLAVNEKSTPPATTQSINRP